MLIDQMKDSLKKAMFDHNDVEKNILRVAIGEVNQLQMTSQQGNKPVTDEQIIKILRKLMVSNTEVLQNTPDGDRKNILLAENKILEVMIPKQLSQDEIRAKLTKELPDVINMTGGKAMGLAMKFFKDQGDFVDGNDVKAVIQSMGN